MDSLIRNHAFVDGNKRTGIAAAGLLLRRTGWRLNATNEELETFTLHVGEAKPDIAEIAAWLETHSVPDAPRQPVH